MQETWKSVADNAFVSRAMTYVHDYTSTMKDLMLNTLDDVKGLPAQLHLFGFHCPDLTILLTACCSLLGIVITFTILTHLFKFLKWICLGSESPHYIGTATVHVVL